MIKLLVYKMATKLLLVILEVYFLEEKDKEFLLQEDCLKNNVRYSYLMKQLAIWIQRLKNLFNMNLKIF